MKNINTHRRHVRRVTVFVVAVAVGGAVLAGLFATRSDDHASTPFVALTENLEALPEAREPEIIDVRDGDVVDLTASVVKKTIGNDVHPMLAYNGSIPGPLLRIEQGAHVRVTLKNETPIETLLHSHGVRMDNLSDGTHLVQDPIAPGETYTYELTFPDAGLFWYHPHLREDAAQELGLYGGMLVVPEPEAYGNPVHREEVLFVDDVLIEDGEMVPFGEENANFALMGRYGNVYLVNGDTDYRLHIQPGEVVRFFVANAANTRPFRLAFSGDVHMKLVGADASAYEQETWQESITLGPSERAVIEVLFPEVGVYDLLNDTPASSTKIGSVTAEGAYVADSYVEEFNVLKTHGAVVASIDPYRDAFDRTPDKILRLSVDMSTGMQARMSEGTHMMDGGHSMHGGMMMNASEDGIEWEDDGAMNAQSDTESVQWNVTDVATGQQNMDIGGWEFDVGDVVKIRIENPSNTMHPMQHPIHFHGQRFLVVSRDGVLEENMAWKDTVFIPAGEDVEILMEVSNPGIWMAHCHIAEHLEAGMAFPFTVQERDS